MQLDVYVHRNMLSQKENRCQLSNIPSVILHFVRQTEKRKIYLYRYFKAKLYVFSGRQLLLFEFTCTLQFF